MLSGINDSNQFVGSYMDAKGITHGITTPEPSAAVLWMTGLLVLGAACWQGAKRKKCSTMR